MLVLKDLRRIVVKKIIGVLGIIFLANIIFIPYPVISIAIQEVKAANVLPAERKVSKDISKKFCNSLGFGLSDESAMRFALGENSQENKNSALIDENGPIDLIINLESDIMEKCGYLIGSSNNLARIQIEAMINDLKS